MDSLLLELLSVFESQTSPGVSWTVFISIAAALAPIVTTYSLLRRRDVLENSMLLVAPFVLMGAVGIVLPMLMSAFLSDERVLKRSATVLERSNALGYLTNDRLYLEILIIVALFLVAVPLYSRMLFRRLERKRSFLSLALDCGQESLYTVGIIFVGIFVLTGRYVLTELPDAWVRLYFYGAVAVAYKAIVCLFILVYVSIFGARGQTMRKLNALPETGDNTLIELAEQPIIASTMDASNAIFSMVRRKSLVRFAAYMFPPFLSGLCILILIRNTTLQDFLEEFNSTAFFMVGIFGIAIAYILFIALRFLLWIIVPRLHLLPRHLKTLGEGDYFEYAAVKFLREYNAPLYKWSNGIMSTANRRFILTENFLVDESRVVMRIYNLKDITKIDISPRGYRRLCFANGKHCNIDGAPDEFLRRLSQ